MYCSLVENLLQINRKLFLKLPWSLVSVRQHLVAGVECQSIREGSVAPILFSFTLKPEETLSVQAVGSPVHISGNAHICKTASTFLPTTCPKVLPICQSLWLKCYLGVWWMLFFSFSIFSCGFAVHDYIWLCVCSVCICFLFAFFYMTRI